MINRYIYADGYSLELCKDLGKGSTVSLRIRCNGVIDLDGNTTMVQELKRFDISELDSIGTLECIIKDYLDRRIERLLSGGYTMSDIAYFANHTECLRRIVVSKYVSKKSQTWMDNKYTPENINMEQYWEHIKKVFKSENKTEEQEQ